MEFTIRNLQKKDSKEVASLIFQLTQNIKNPKNLPARIKTLANPGAGSKFFVAESADKVIGFGGLAWYMIPSKGLISWIEEVVVDKKYRNQGVGRALMEKIMAFAQSKKIRVLKLTAANPIAKNLYTSLGFSKKDSDCLFKDLF